MFAFVRIKSKINKKSRSRILTILFRPKVSWKRQNESREDRDYEVIICRELLLCDPFCLLSSYGKSLYNASF